MSAQTKAALDAAIRAHIADEHGGSLTASWLTIVERVPLEGDDNCSYVEDLVPDGQSAFTTIGLAHYTAQNRSAGGRDDD